MIKILENLHLHYHPSILQTISHYIWNQYELDVNYSTIENWVKYFIRISGQKMVDSVANLALSMINLVFPFSF